MVYLADVGDFIGDVGGKIAISLPALITQLLATLILFLVIKKFLYPHAINYINKRKEYITNSVDQATKMNEQAQKNVQASEEALKEAYKEAHTIVDNAKIEALNQKDKILKETQEEVINKKAQLDKDLEAEKIKMRETIRREMVDVALLAASKVIDREVNDSDNEKLVKNFIEGDN
ncbi:MAG: F0F1 ATP synthase subunit B [Bacilli bacterium]|nr:F0F1 ATP synthase subunit B [Bacilli bacterium]